MAAEPDFLLARLQDRVVRSAQQADLVRLNGALLTTLGLYPRSVAVAEVWTPALNRLEGAAWARARQAMSAQLVDEWQRRNAV
jgi:hypothetical protein